LDSFKQLPETLLSPVFTASLAYLTQQQLAASLLSDPSTTPTSGTWLSKLYTRLLKLPMSHPVTVLLQTILNAHNTFQKSQKDAHLQLIVHLMSHSVGILSQKVGKKNSPYEYRMNALKILRFFLFGYRMQARYFTDQCENYLTVILELKEAIK
jgi:hypothetical protein